jgi:DNA-binding HxlR family transcriptional regulator
MRWRDIGDLTCSVARALSVVGDRWTLLILRDAFLGVRRFEDFQDDLGTTRHRLADRLRKLVEHGVLERVRYAERPPRFEYRLTEKGRELNVALTALRQWGDAHLSEKPPRLLRRKVDRRPVVAALVPRSADVLRPDEVELVPGPGLKTT